MTPIFPNERLSLEQTGRQVRHAHYGSDLPDRKRTERYDRSPPKAGKTTLLKAGATAIRTEE